MSNLKKTITLSGGLHYHFKALRYKSQWQDFRHSLNAFLKTWNPQSKKLTIVGPSGGYCLETEFLNKFQSVSCYDLDPLAKWFFSFNHKTKTQWFVKDFFKHRLNPRDFRKIPHQNQMCYAHFFTVFGKKTFRLLNF